jgi:hypothetical protein
VLLLGSGSTAARMRGALVTAPGSVTILELAPVYHRVAAALGLPVDQLNLEGAARIGDRLRWFQRGNSAAGVPSAAVDVSLTALLGTGQADAGGAGETKVGNAGETQVGSAIGTEVGSANKAQVGNAGETQVGGTSKAQVDGAGDARVGGAGEVEVGGAQAYDLGAVGGVALAVTDAVALPDGRVLVSAAAEDTPNAVDDGPVVGAAIALLDDTTVLAIAALPSGPPKAARTDQSSNSKPHEGEQHEGEQHEGGQHEGGRGRTGRRQAERHEAEQHKAVSPARPYKIEGLALQDFDPGGVTLIAVVDADDPLAASRRLELRVFW